MDQKPRLFIYERKEMGVLIVLGSVIAAFAFTLGVHLGKKVGPLPTQATPSEAQMVLTKPDPVPNRQELSEQAKGAQQAADESLNQALHDEVARTGIRLDSPRQLALPEKPVTKNAGATTPATATSGPNVSGLHAISAANRRAPHGKFTLQVGSYPKLEEAKDQTDALDALGLEPYLRETLIKGKGSWYRVFLGGFDTQEAAKEAGERFQSQHVIDSFVISKTEG